MKTFIQLAVGVLALCAFFSANAYAQGGSVTITSQRPVANQGPIDAAGIPAVTGISPGAGAQGVLISQPVAISLNHPVDPSTVNATTVFATWSGGTLSANLALSVNRQVITMNFPGALPGLTEVTIHVNGNAMKTVPGLAFDADQDGRPGGTGEYSFFTAPPLGQGAGLIVGRVFRSDGTPLVGAVITSVLFPATEGDPPLPVPPGITDANGDFTYTTIPITGATSFLVQVRKPGFSESLREVTLMAGGCWRIDDTFLQPVAAPVMVKADVGATLTDATGTVELIIPPGALIQDSNIAITILESSDFIRDKLPELVAEQGTFVDVFGVFLDQTNFPVTMRVPNKFNLPLIDPNTGQPTRVPLGKVDHNTLEWVDMRDAYDGPGTAPDSFLGTVVSRGAGETAIEFQLDHFCTVCVGHCRNITKGDACGDDNASGDPDCSEEGGPGFSDDNSVVGLVDGQLWEYIDLPGFVEFGQEAPFRMGYSSTAASSSVTLSAFVDYDNLRPVERTTFEYSIEGQAVSGTYDYSEDNQKPASGYRWDGRNVQGTYLPTGSYPYRIQTMSLNSDVKVSLPAVFGGEPVSIQQALTFPGLSEMRQDPLDLRATLVNLRESPYGSGWSLMCEARLYLDPDGCIVLVQGNGDHRQFHPSKNQPYLWDSPAGEPSVLTADPETSTYIRTWSTGRSQTFNAAGRILTSADAYGFEMTFTYVGDLLTQVVTRSGHVYDIFYDGAGKLDRIVDSAGRITEFLVDANGDLVQYTNSVSVVHSFLYDVQHRLVRHNRPRGDYSTYTYQAGRIDTVQAYDTTDRGQNLLRTREFRQNVTDADLATGLNNGQGTVLDPIPVADGFVSYYVNGLGSFREIATDKEGNVSYAFVPGSGRTLYTYNTEGAVASLTNAEGSRTEYDYDDAGDLEETRTYDLLDQLVALRTYESNGPFNKLTKFTGADGFSTFLTYDVIGNILTWTMGGATHLLVYQDAVFPHLVSRTTMANGEVIDYTYTTHGNLATVTDYPDPTVYPQGRTTTMTYDAAGQRTSITDHSGAITQFTYDGLGRLTQQIFDSGDTVSFSYVDPVTGLPTDFLSQVTYENGATLRYLYDGLNRLVERVDQQGLSSHYTYDAEGNRTAILNRNGELVLQEFDGEGRLVLRTLPGDERTEFAYDALGNPISLVNDTCSVAFEWDELGRVVSSEARIDSVLPGGGVAPIVHRLEYDTTAGGRVRGVTDSTGFIDTSYLFGPLGDTDNLTAAGLGQSWDWIRDGVGRPISVTRMGTNDTTTYSYDGAGGSVAISHLSDPNTGIDYGTQDARGSIPSALFKLLGASIGTAYGYDGDDQLTTVDQGLSDGDQRLSITYAHNPAGRLTADTEYSYGFDAEGRMTSRTSLSDSKVETFTYNADGALIRVEHQVDIAGTPTTVMTADYAYDPLGRRVERCVNGVSMRYVYDRLNPILEIDANSEVEFAYVFEDGLDQPIAVKDVVGDQTLYYHADRQGNVIALSNDAGSIVQTYRYDEHGRILEVEDEHLQQPFLFTGREFDPESGLYYFRNRYYHPELGRFMSEDPLGIFGGFNLYAFGGNNTVNQVDPLGLKGSSLGSEALRRQQAADEIRNGNGIPTVQKFVKYTSLAKGSLSHGHGIVSSSTRGLKILSAVQPYVEQGLGYVDYVSSAIDPTAIIGNFLNGGAVEYVAERNAVIDYAQGKGYRFDD